MVELDAVLHERGWSRSRTVYELRKVAENQGQRLPSDESMIRMLREWANGRREMSETYGKLFYELFKIDFRESNSGEDSSQDDLSTQLTQRLGESSSIDAEIVQLFEQQTNGFRKLDRRLGAARLLADTETHAATMRDLFSFAIPGASREHLASALAEASALAGWQALDQGDPQKAWLHHETAKFAARESSDPSVLAHVTAQQAYALHDVGRTQDALQAVQYALSLTRSNVPSVMKSWLYAAIAEMEATNGNSNATLMAFDKAYEHFDRSQEENIELPYIFLAEPHLVRWRGHCLAKLGSAEAVEDLNSALASFDTSFTRAVVALHVDLAIAHKVRGEDTLAKQDAASASSLASQITSIRQRNRIQRLVESTST